MPNLLNGLVLPWCRVVPSVVVYIVDRDSVVLGPSRPTSDTPPRNAICSDPLRAPIFSYSVSRPRFLRVLSCSTPSFGLSLQRWYVLCGEGVVRAPVRRRVFRPTVVVCDDAWQPCATIVTSRGRWRSAAEPCSGSRPELAPRASAR